MSIREAKYPWNRVGQGMNNFAGGITQGHPQNTFSDLAAGRRNGSGPPSSKPWEGGAEWQESQRNGGRGAKWRGRGRGELVTNHG